MGLNVWVSVLLYLFSPLPQAEQTHGKAEQVAVVNKPEISTKKSTPTFFDISISEDKKKATITSFNVAIYNNPKLKLDRAWFEDQLKALGMSHKFNDEIWKPVEEALLTKKSLNDLTAALATEPKPGSEPYIHLVYKEGFAVNT